MSTNRPDLSMTPGRQRRNADAADRVQEDVQKEETRQLNVAVPLELHREMRMRVAQEDITLKELTLRAIEAYLKT